MHVAPEKAKHDRPTDRQTMDKVIPIHVAPQKYL